MQSVKSSVPTTSESSFVTLDLTVEKLLFEQKPEILSTAAEQ